MRRIMKEWVIAMFLGLVISCFFSRNVFGAEAQPKPETVTIEKKDAERLKLLLQKLDEYTKALESENYELRGRVESFKGRGCS